MGQHVSKSKETLRAPAMLVLLENSVRKVMWLSSLYSAALTQSWINVFLNMQNLSLTFPDIDECKSSPCENEGTCLNERGNYTCTCNAGFTGRLCEKGNVVELTGWCNTAPQ